MLNTIPSIQGDLITVTYLFNQFPFASITSDNTLLFFIKLPKYSKEVGDENGILTLKYVWANTFDKGAKITPGTVYAAYKEAKNLILEKDKVEYYKSKLPKGYIITKQLPSIH
tara:strand:+ start:16639 stop:16977 length:339 start_codon:yes stop_codon:yes gene_type:complete